MIEYFGSSFGFGRVGGTRLHKFVVHVFHFGFARDVKLHWIRFDLCLAHAWAIARTRAATKAPVVIVELISTDGTVGLGEAAPVDRYQESTQSVDAFLCRTDANKLSFDDIPASMAYLDAISATDRSAKCAINLALYDGAAKRARKPLHDYLGLPFRDRHVTSFTIGIDKPETIRAKVIAAEQYPILKMKLGGQHDKGNLSSLREVAPSKPLRVDANEGWSTKEQALEMIEWLATTDNHIQFVEQPLPASSPVKDWAWLKQRSPLPIFGDESYRSAEDAEPAVECFHGVNVKLSKSGGVSGGFEALKAAKRAGLKTMLGCMIETSILISAAAQLAELCDYLDLDGNLLVTNDPYMGVTAENGVLSFAKAPESVGLCVGLRPQ